MDISFLVSSFYIKVQYLGNRDHKKYYFKLTLCSILLCDGATLNYIRKWEL